MIEPRRVPLLHPGSKVDYSILWHETTLGEGASIATSEWGRMEDDAFVPGLPAGLLLESSSSSAHMVTAIITADTAVDGDIYDVVNQIDTSSGLRLHELVRIRISETGH